MLPIVFVTMLAAHLGPIAADAPARGPQIAANGSMVALTFGAGKGIYISTSVDAGKTFSTPLKIAEGAILPLTRHRGPRVAFSGSTIVVTAITGKKLAEGPHAHGLPADGDLFSWRSTDRGKTWSKGVIVNDAPGAPTEGLHSLTADAKGALFASWLDKRSGTGTQLYGARSTDGGATWTRNTLVYQSPEGTICQCCHPSIAVDAGGQIVVMWRNWLGGARDMYLARSRDGLSFSKPEKLGTGSWQLNACPMDGGALAVSANRIVTAWRREDKIFLAEPGQPEKQIGSGKDVAVALSGDRTYVIWTSGTRIQSWIGGKVDVLSSAGGFPHVSALQGGGALAAWEEGDAIQIRRMP